MRIEEHFKEIQDALWKLEKEALKQRRERKEMTSDGLVSYLDSLKKMQPVKCQHCECLEVVWRNGDWIANCSESECCYPESKGA